MKLCTNKLRYISSMQKSSASQMAKHFDRENHFENPWRQLRSLHEKALPVQGTNFMTSMALTTASKSGHPSIRFMLYELTENDKLMFYTNYGSRKSENIDENPFVSAVITWPELKLQIRIEGILTRSRDQNGSWDQQTVLSVSRYPQQGCLILFENVSGVFRKREKRLSDES